MKNIAVMCGGDSSEREISTKSALNIVQFIDREKYNPYIVFIEKRFWYVMAPESLTVDAVLAHKDAPVMDKNDFSCTLSGSKLQFDIAFIMIHGTPGENGLLQGYLEMMKIPFNTCSSFVSAITFDKHSCKRFLDFAGVKMAEDVFIRKEHPYSIREIIRRLGLPIFVKPTVGGSSFGISKVKKEEELEPALQKAFTECDTILAEAAVKGRELTNGIYKLNGMIHHLPVTEIITKREYFDYEAKYLGESDEVCPANISPALRSKIQNLSERIYSYMGCNGIVRMDYIVDEKEDIYFLEVNTVPGMTKMSLVPKMLEVEGIAMKDFVTSLLEESSC